MSRFAASLLFSPVAAIVLTAPAFAEHGAFQTYSRAAFEAAMAAGQPVIAHVHADWCPTCRRQQQVLNAFISEPAARGVKGFTVSFDTDRAFKTANRVTSQSTIIVFKGGREVARATGQTDTAAIRNLAAKAL